MRRFATNICASSCSGFRKPCDNSMARAKTGKPVELIYLPDAVHILVKPWERLTSQQGDVDWFYFWIKDENDSSKRKQYDRWNDLQRLSAADLHK